MSEIDGKGISQLLLSPLFLLNHILGTVVPGAVLILLLALKGNLLLRAGWLNPLFGYKTKVALFVMLAFVFGSMLRLPLQLLALVIKPSSPKPPEEFLKGQPDVVRQIVSAAMTDGVLLARPTLMDRLSHLQTDVAFHIGMGTALAVAALVSGDGSLRLLEGLLGLAMFLVGIRKGMKYNEQVLSVVGIGIVDILGNMTPQQISIAKAAIKSLGLGTIEAQVPLATTETPALASKPESASIEKGPEPEGPALIS
jgi:hypothetical protein